MVTNFATFPLLFIDFFLVCRIFCLLRWLFVGVTAAAVVFFTFLLFSLDDDVTSP